MPIKPQDTLDPGVARASRLPAREAFRRLRLAGLSTAEAGSLVAHLAGLASVPGGWTLLEVERLHFVRALVARGRLRS